MDDEKRVETRFVMKTPRGCSDLHGLRRLDLGLVFFVAILTLILTAHSARANEITTLPESSQTPSPDRPLWQFGFGAGAGVAPHYPASDQSSLRFLASPTFRYRGRVLRSDDEGTRARLLKFENAEVDLSGAASFPVDAGDNEARRGMRPLDWVGEAGPRLNLRWRFQNPGKIKGDVLRFTLPFRAVASSNGSTSLAHRGFILQPGISFERVLNAPTVLKSEISVEVDGYMSFIDPTLGNYYFGVADLDANSSRRAYDAKAGLLAASVGLTFFVTPKDFSNGSSFFVGIRNATMAWSANRESPLHKTDQQLSFFAGFNLLWINSSSRESRDDDHSRLAPVQPQPIRP